MSAYFQQGQEKRSVITRCHSVLSGCPLRAVRLYKHEHKKLYAELGEKSRDIYISTGVGRTQGFDILELKLVSAYIKVILLNACNAGFASEDQAFK